MREADRTLGVGKTIPEVAKALEVSENTYRRWQRQFGGMKADDARRLRELERENARLKAVVADKELELRAIKELTKGKLVSSARRRRAVAMLRDRLGVSERWACRVVGQQRSTQRYTPTIAVDDEALRARLREISAERPRWGYRRAHARLAGEGWVVKSQAAVCRQRLARRRQVDVTGFGL